MTKVNEVREQLKAVRSNLATFSGSIDTLNKMMSELPDVNQDNKELIALTAEIDKFDFSIAGEIPEQPLEKGLNSIASKLADCLSNSNKDMNPEDALEASWIILQRR